MTCYRGRFAPTPTGPLHFGSLVTALGSYLDARHVGGEWLLRIEDIDLPRCPTGSVDTILRQLNAFGLHWDGSVNYQSTRNAAYQAALEHLLAMGLAYPCSCSRKQWQHYPLYPGWCRNAIREPHKPLAWRLRSDLGLRPVIWEDRLFGRQHFDPAHLGDVILKRKDKLWAYQLAVVVDDAEQGVSDVVRGIDLLDNTPWQRQLQAALGYPQLRYLHLPLIVTNNGQKLSKQNLAPPLPHHNDRAVRELLYQALLTLDQAPDPAAMHAPVEEQLSMAIRSWDPSRLRAISHRHEPSC